MSHASRRASCALPPRILALCALGCAAFGCSSLPEFVRVSLSDGVAERVLGVTQATIEGSIRLEVSSPAQSETTELLLTDLRLDYLFSRCQFERRHPWPDGSALKWSAR